MAKALFPKMKLDELWREARRLRWTHSRELEITEKVLQTIEHLKEKNKGAAAHNFEIAAIIRIMADLDTQNRIRTALMCEVLRSLLATVPRDKAREIQQKISELTVENLRTGAT